MCTVTYVPRGNDNFVLTSNRDENAARSPQNISVIEQEGIRLAFPRDTEAGGTWIAISETNKVVCLLNGAFTLHDRRPPYRKSRGIMVLEFFAYEKAEHFFQQYNFSGIEPFTMIIYDQGMLYELRWDGVRRHVRSLDTKGFYIWSSATLYESPVRIKREKWFAEWQQNRNDYDLEGIMDFHRNAGEGDPWNDVIMNRKGIVQTVSITNVIKEGPQFDMWYHDLLNVQSKSEKIIIKGEVVGSH